MIFSQLAYCNFDTLPQHHSLQSLASDEEIKTLAQGNLGGKNTEKLIKIMLENPRFKKLCWRNVVSKVDAKHKCNLMLLHFVLQKINTILHIGEQRLLPSVGKKILICLLMIGYQLITLLVLIIEKSKFVFREILSWWAFKGRKFSFAVALNLKRIRPVTYC